MNAAPLKHPAYIYDLSSLENWDSGSVLCPFEIAIDPIKAGFQMRKSGR